VVAEAEPVGHGHDRSAEEHEGTTGQNERQAGDVVAGVQDHPAKDGAEGGHQVMSASVKAHSVISELSALESAWP
jgi:hypothetical protein